MIVERYDPVNLFEFVRYPHSLTRGRHSTPVEAILRLLVVFTTERRTRPGNYPSSPFL